MLDEQVSCSQFMGNLSINVELKVVLLGGGVTPQRLYLTDDPIWIRILQCSGSKTKVPFGGFW